MNRRQQIIELDKRHVWHPYTAMGPYIEQASPLVIERASGSRLFDADGRSYIDANSSWYCASLGHDHPRLLAALHEQLATVAHVPLAGITHEPAVELARALVARAPWLPRVFYSDNGSTAIEVALKLCLQYWHQNGRPERTRFVALEGAFHGETLGATALGGVDVFRRPFASVVLDCVHVPPEPSGYEAAFATLSRALSQAGDSIAGVVLEPVVQAAGGMRIYDPELLRAARELTRKHDTFLVLDEVFTGFGRTGPFWAATHAGVEADLLCTGKGLSGGLLPFAATLASERIFEGFLGAPERAFYYGHTYCGNPLGARLALEVLRVYDDEHILEQAKPKALRIQQTFARLRSEPHVARTRSLGMVGALDLSGGEGYLESRGQTVYAEALRRGAYLRPLGNTVYVTPPINIPDADLNELLGIVEESVRAARG
ncbi:MAG TPA: adenosylmethionine--8-amino-7-oxononanoate transaminase [Polyangiaceae bacterium]|nr:adenosylmethionine--8-amino-7-oxononanoate transaminase [Polyangiaceae bacterium]